jgi:hypothetical protein
MLFLKPHDCPTANRDPATVPLKSLKRYKRVSLQPRQTRLVRLSVAAADLQLHGIPGVRSLRQYSAAGACACLTACTQHWQDVRSSAEQLPVHIGADAHASCQWIAEIGGQQQVFLQPKLSTVA